MWNDLSENDVIYPSDGVEYVLKGSEIFPGCSSSGTHLSFASISFEFYHGFLRSHRRQPGC